MVSAEVDNLIVEWCFTLSDSDEASIEGTEELIEALVACAGEKRKGSVDMSLVHKSPAAILHAAVLKPAPVSWTWPVDSRSTCHAQTVPLRHHSTAPMAQRYWE